MRAQRRGRMSDNILTAVLLALAIAANFTAAFILVSEAFWLCYLLIARLKVLPGADIRRVTLIREDPLRAPPKCRDDSVSPPAHKSSTVPYCVRVGRLRLGKGP